MNWLGLGKLALAAFGASQSAKAAKEQYKSSQTDLKKLRDDAQAAGFNPLTVLRATGGQGFNKGSSGALASATFWGNFANAGVSALNEIDPYNQKRKELDMQQSVANLDNIKTSTAYTKGLIGQLASNIDPYAPYKDTVPVRVGRETLQLDMSVAKRMGIEPNSVITPGDLEELLGEVHGNLASTVAVEIQEAVLPGSGVTGVYGKLENPLPYNARQKFSKGMTWLKERSPDALRMEITPFSNPAWSNEWKNFK